MLLLDNHGSHMSIEGLDLCKKNGVTLLTFPPHCSHRLQPLDVAVYAPLKKYYSTACTSWMHRNPAIPMTIMNISECLSDAYFQAFTPKNVLSGFRATGIWPLNQSVFFDDDFAASNVTDREFPPAQSSEVDTTLSTEGKGFSFCVFFL